MVHQLSLVSSIPHSNYLQTIATLQAITGIFHPQQISTYTLITKPNHVFKPKFEPGKINQIEQYYMKCITTWSNRDLDISQPILNNRVNGVDDIVARKLFTDEEDDGDGDEVGGGKNQFGKEKVWTLQISDIPIAGKNQTCSQQTIYESTLVHTHVAAVDKSDMSDAMEVDIKQEMESKPDAAQVDPSSSSSAASNSIVKNRRNGSFLLFLNDLGYAVINQYWIKGVRFFYGDVIIELFKIFIRDDSQGDDEVGNGIKLKLLDESNTFQIKCYINVAKSTDIEVINSGIKELGHLQDFLKGLFLLEISDRMFLDSRVTSSVK
ncbi:uncharacterized protein LODBEIA_P37340 [Lodderomyces beijingensis]|uniref:Mediator of RNA polymerase II transcription subunit 18 n=1 Tax=Lodderomyces beijingensis TaxID=1775926 RepID=A0ABP0ZTK8_9ASCO